MTPRNSVTVVSVFFPLVVVLHVTLVPKLSLLKCIDLEKSDFLLLNWIIKNG